MAEYKRYNLTLRVVDPSARDRFRSLSRPETFFEIRPNREPGERGAYSILLAQSEYEAALEDAQDPGSNLIAVEPDPPLLLAAGAGGAPDDGTLAYVAAQYADSLSMTGAGVTVGVLDSGLGSGLASSVFAGRIQAAKSFVSNPGDPYVDTLDEFGGYHGSNMASAAVPPKAELAVGQVSGVAEGSGSTLAAGIYWLVDEVGADIINCSVVVTTSQVLQDAVTHAQARNVIVVAAAGNFGNGTVYYPAGYGAAFAVSNYDPRTDAISSDSNYGNHIWAAAPGRNIYVLQRVACELILVQTTDHESVLEGSQAQSAGRRRSRYGP